METSYKTNQKSCGETDLCGGVKYLFKNSKKKKKRNEMYLRLTEEAKIINALNDHTEIL